MFYRFFHTAFVFCLCLFLASCAIVPEGPDHVRLSPARFGDLPGWGADRHAQTLAAFEKSCARILKADAARVFGPDGIGGVYGDWQPACRALDDVQRGNDMAARAYFEKWFMPHAVSGSGWFSGKGLFTGYYEAEVNGADKPDQRYRIPLYRRPPELVMVDLGQFRDELRGQRIAGRVEDGRLKVFSDRAEILDGALGGRGLELVWLDDPVDAFFIQIQGSGVVTTPDGREKRIGYDGQNGHIYYAIGRELIARDEIRKEDISLQSIRAWLETHPDQAEALMNLNRSYVFFRDLGQDGPMGGEGLALTPGRSLAIDRSLVPYGVPVWLDADPAVGDAARVRRLLIAQDTGGAIRGAVRGDVFWGHGENAEFLAGHMKSRGRYWFLLPRTPGP